MANKRTFAIPGRTLGNVQNMKRVNAITLTMKKIEQVPKVEAGVEAQDPIDQKVDPERVERKEEEKERQRVRETLLLLPKIEAPSRVTSSYDHDVPRALIVSTNMIRVTLKSLRRMQRIFRRGGPKPRGRIF